MHVALERVLKFIAGVVFAVALVFLALTYGFYFYGAKYAPRDWAPAPTVYPDSVRRAWWRIEVDSEPVVIETISPPGMAWRVAQDLHGRPRQDPVLRALGRVARLEDSHFDTGHHHAAEWTMMIRASRWPQDRVVDTILDRSSVVRNARGLTAGAQRVFARPLTSLDDGEVALLISIIWAPGYTDPWCHGDRLRKRMAARTTLTPAQIDAAFSRLGPQPAEISCR